MLPTFTMLDFFLFIHVQCSCDALLLMGAALRRPCLCL